MMCRNMKKVILHIFIIKNYTEISLIIQKSFGRDSTAAEMNQIKTTNRR